MNWVCIVLKYTADKASIKAEGIWEVNYGES